MYTSQVEELQVRRTRNHWYPKWIAITAVDPPTYIRRYDIGNDVCDILIESGRAIPLPDTYSETADDLLRVHSSWWPGAYDNMRRELISDLSCDDPRKLCLLWIVKDYTKNKPVWFQTECIDNWNQWWDTEERFRHIPLSALVRRTRGFLFERLVASHLYEDEGFNVPHVVPDE